MKSTLREVLNKWKESNGTIFDTSENEQVEVEKLFQIYKDFLEGHAGVDAEGFLYVTLFTKEPRRTYFKNIS